MARLPSTLIPGPLRGFVDQASAASGEITGWAQDLSHPELPVSLEVFYEDQLIGSVLACQLRDDLMAAKIGRCAFRFVSPIPLDPERLHTLKIRRVSDGFEVTPTEACLSSMGLEVLLPELSSTMVA